MNPDSDNHLGSSTFLTDAAGEPYQFVMYLPFGDVRSHPDIYRLETFTEQRAAGFGTPYLFNAKELDEETGLYYYGARYYDARISTWWGVDPLAGEMPAWSSYAYTFQNPLRFMDPTGMVPEEAFDPDPPGQELPTILVTAPRIRTEGPISGISNALKSIPEIAQTFGTNFGAILPKGIQKEERNPDFGAQLYKTNGGTQWGLSIGQAGETRYSPNANVGPNLDQFMPAVSIAKASVNPLNAFPFLFQYGVDAVDAGMSLKSAYSNSGNGAGISSQTPMLEIGRVFYRNHGPYPTNGVRDTVIDGHRIFSNGSRDSIAPIYFSREAYKSSPNGSYLSAKKTQTN